MEESNKMELWALVELFGHSKVAGKVSEHNLGSATFIRVDVPETPKNGPFTRFLNPSAIYAINPMTEEAARVFANQIEAAPIQAWDVKRMHEKILALGQGQNDDDEDFD